MQNHPKLGEIIVPGPNRNSGIRSFILTDIGSGGQRPEMLFGLLTAEAPKKIVDKLADRLIDEIRSSFFSGAGTPETRYESALKQANKSILAFLHEHRLSLPGIKLRGIMAALSDDTLFITNRGSLRGILIVGKRGKPTVMRLFSESSDTSTNPKFFSSFQEGTMPPGAVFIAGTRELFSAVDEPFLRKIFTERDPADAGRELRKGLSDKTDVAALTLAMPSETPVDHTMPVRTATTALASPKTRKRRNDLLPVNMDIGEIGAKSIEGFLVFLLKYLKLIPKALVALFRGLVMLLRLLTHIPNAIRTLADGNRRAHFATNFKAIPKHVARNGLFRFNALPNRNKAHLLLLVAISAVFIHGILYSLHKHSEALAAKTYESHLAEIGQLETDLDTSLIIGNDQRSHDALARLSTLIADLPEDDAGELDTKRTLTEALEERRAKIRRYVTIGDPETLVTFEDPDGHFTNGAFTWFNRALYLFAPDGTSVKSFGLDGSSHEESIAAPKRIRDAAPASTGVLLAFEDGTIGFWRPGSEDVLVYPDANIGDSPILYYQGRLYSVHDDGMLERRPILDGVLGASANVLQSPSDIQSLSSIAADGAAYLLSRQGELRKYLKGEPVEGFRPPVIDPPPRMATDLWVDVGSRWLVFLERGSDRIVMIDATTGRLAAQLVSKDFGNISAMTVDSGGDHAYLVSGTRIIAVPLKGPGIN